MFYYSRSGTYIDVGDVGVLVDVHVGDLVTGVWAQGPVTRLAGAGAGAEAGGEEAGVLVRGARQRGAARPAGDQPRAGHRVRPPRPEASCGRRGAAVKIRAHSRLQWVVSSEYESNEWVEEMGDQDPGWKNRSNVSSHLSIPGHVNGIFALATTTNCQDNVVFSNKIF